MSKQNPNPGQNIISSSINPLANVVACGVAMFGGPELYMRTLPFVQRFAESRYGPDFAGPVQLAWFALTFGFVFYTSRIGLAFAIIALSGSLALRLFAA